MILQPGDIAIDYSSARPAPSAIAAAGVKLVVRYDSPNLSNPKNLTNPERAGLHGAGLGLLVVFEARQLDPLQGATLGEQHGRIHELHLNDFFHYPADVLSIVAVDFDTTLSQIEIILDYLQAFNDNTSRPLWVYGEADLVDTAVLRGVVVGGWQTVAWSHKRVSQYAYCLQHATPVHPTVPPLGSVDDNTVLKSFKAWSTTPDPTPPTPPIGDDDMATVTFEVTGLPGIYMWTPGSDPIPFTDVPTFQDMSAALDAKPLDAPITEAMYQRLFVKAINVTVPPITVPPYPTKFSGTLST